MNDRHRWGNGFWILCVDDDVLNLQLRAGILERCGCMVVTATDPVKACHLNTDLFDLVILDLDMPTMDGHQCLLRLRKSGARCPCMLLSGNLESASKEIQEQFAVCHPKGESIHVFLAEVRRLLERPSCKA